MDERAERGGPREIVPDPEPLAVHRCFCRVLQTHVDRICVDTGPDVRKAQWPLHEPFIEEAKPPDIGNRRLGLCGPLQIRSTDGCKRKLQRQQMNTLVLQSEDELIDEIIGRPHGDRKDPSSIFLEPCVAGRHGCLLMMERNRQSSGLNDRTVAGEIGLNRKTSFPEFRDEGAGRERERCALQGGHDKNPYEPSISVIFWPAALFCDRLTRVGWRPLRTPDIRGRSNGEAPLPARSATSRAVLSGRCSDERGADLRPGRHGSVPRRPVTQEVPAVPLPSLGRRRRASPHGGFDGGERRLGLGAVRPARLGHVGTAAAALAAEQRRAGAHEVDGIEA